MQQNSNQTVISAAIRFRNQNSRILVRDLKIRGTFTGYAKLQTEQGVWLQTEKPEDVLDDLTVENLRLEYLGNNGTQLNNYTDTINRVQPLVTNIHLVNNTFVGMRGCIGLHAVTDAVVAYNEFYGFSWLPSNEDVVITRSSRSIVVTNNLSDKLSDQPDKSGSGAPDMNRGTSFAIRSSLEDAELQNIQISHNIVVNNVAFAAATMSSAITVNLTDGIPNRVSGIVITHNEIHHTNQAIVLRGNPRQGTASVMVENNMIQNTHAIVESYGASGYCFDILDLTPDQRSRARALVADTTLTPELADLLNNLRQTLPDKNRRNLLMQRCDPTKAFPMGAAAFGSGGACPLQPSVRTPWPVETQLLVQREVKISGEATDVRILVSVDNDIVDVFVNGTSIARNIAHGFCSLLDEFRFDVPQALVKPGITDINNVIAFHVVDRGVESFFDTRIKIPGTGIGIVAMDNPYIIDNHISSTEGPGIAIKDSLNPVVTSNTIRDAQEEGISLERTASAALRGDPRDPKKVLVDASALNNVHVGPNAVNTLIADGTLSSAAQAGVLIETGAEDTVIQHITFENNAQSDVIDHGEGTVMLP